VYLVGFLFIVVITDARNNEPETAVLTYHILPYCLFLPSSDPIHDYFLAYIASQEEVLTVHLHYIDYT
jgi:hypothetical protein